MKPRTRCQILITILCALALFVVAQSAFGSEFSYNYAFLWSPDKGLKNLGALDGGFSYATDVNDRGEVVGFSNDKAFYWSEQTGMVALPSLGGTGQTEARGINNLGQIVGLSSATDGLHAVLWTPIHEIEDLGIWPLGTGRPYDINDSGVIASSPYLGINNLGQLAGSNDSWVATLTTPGTGVQYLGSLYGSGNAGLATDVNNVGQVVGESSNPLKGDEWRAFLWTQNGGMQDLGSFGGPQTIALGINDSTQVVGWGADANDLYRRAFLWTPSGGFVDLFANDGISYGSMASRINNAGQIVGGIGGLVSVPEPSTLLLLGAGLSGLALSRRRFKK